MLQKNIVKNQTDAKYRKWFEFAQKTKNPDNKEEDFLEYMDDEIFREIMKRLDKNGLNEDDFFYIENERELWEEVERYERGVHEDAQKEAYRIAREKVYKEIYEEIYKEVLNGGKEKVREEGRIVGRAEGEKNKALDIAGRLKTKGCDDEFIAETSGLTLEEITQL